MTNYFLRSKPGTNISPRISYTDARTTKYYPLPSTHRTRAQRVNLALDLTWYTRRPSVRGQDSL